MEKDFLKLPLSTQMAIVSFGIGSLLFVLYYTFHSKNQTILLKLELST